MNESKKKGGIIVMDWVSGFSPLSQQNIGSLKSRIKHSICPYVQP